MLLQIELQLDWSGLDQVAINVILPFKHMSNAIGGDRCAVFDKSFNDIAFRIQRFSPDRSAGGAMIVSPGSIGTSAIIKLDLISEDHTRLKREDLASFPILLVFTARNETCLLSHRFPVVVVAYFMMRDGTVL